MWVLPTAVQRIENSVSESEMFPLAFGRDSTRHTHFFLIRWRRIRACNGWSDAGGSGVCSVSIASRHYESMDERSVQVERSITMGEGSEK